MEQRGRETAVHLVRYLRTRISRRSKLNAHAARSPGGPKYTEWRLRRAATSANAPQYDINERRTWLSLSLSRGAHPARVRFSVDRRGRRRQGVATRDPPSLLSSIGLQIRSVQRSPAADATARSGQPHRRQQAPIDASRPLARE